MTIGAVPLLVVAVASQSVNAERVIFCESGSPCPESSRMLGTSSRGTWVLAGDSAVVDAMNRRAAGSAPRVLYFTFADYEAAVSGLTAKERESAILRRAQIVSAAGPTLALEAIRDDLLHTAAAVRDGAHGELDLLRDAAMILDGGTGRLSEVRPVAAVAEVRTSLARILVEFGQGDASSAEYRQEDAILGAIDGELTGRPRPGPFASPERAYFVASVHANPRSDSSFVDQPSYGWRGGSVQVLRPAELGASPWKERKPRLMYQAREIFLKDITSLTASQIDRRLRARLAAVPPSESKTWIATMGFRHSVLMRQYAVPIRRAGASWLPRWEQAVALDDHNLLRVLAEANLATPVQRTQLLQTLRADVILVSAMLRGVAGGELYLAGLSQIVGLVDRLAH